MSRSRSAQKGRRPDWKVWTHLPEWKVWEGVALSLDIDPKKVDRDYSHMAETHIVDEPEEFQDRLGMADRCVYRVSLWNQDAPHGFFRTTSFRFDEGDAVVRAQEFVCWALSVGWPVPADFKKIGSAAVESPDLRDAKIADLEARLAAQENSSGFSNKHRTAQTIMLGLALKCGYEPGKAGQSVTGAKAGSFADDIRSKLSEFPALAGVASPTDETIRKHLRDAVNELPSRGRK